MALSVYKEWRNLWSLYSFLLNTFNFSYILHILQIKLGIFKPRYIMQYLEMSPTKFQGLLV